MGGRTARIGCDPDGRDDRAIRHDGVDEAPVWPCLAKRRRDEAVTENHGKLRVRGGVVANCGHPFIDRLLDVEFEDACGRPGRHEMHVGFDEPRQDQLAVHVADNRVGRDMLRRACCVADVNDGVITHDDRFGPGHGLVDRVNAGIDEREIAAGVIRLRRTGHEPQQGRDQ